jgi:hypothetical protein
MCNASEKGTLALQIGQSLGSEDGGNSFTLEESVRAVARIGKLFGSFARDGFARRSINLLVNRPWEAYNGSTNDRANVDAAERGGR